MYSKQRLENESWLYDYLKQAVCNFGSSKVIPQAVLPRFLAQHVCHGPGLGFFRGVHGENSPSRIQCLKDSERFVFDPKSGEIESLPLFFSDRSLDVGHCLGNCGKTQLQSMVLRERRWKNMKHVAPKWRNLFQTTRAWLQIDWSLLRIWPVQPVHLTAGPHHRVGPLCLRLAAVQSLGDFCVVDECGKFWRSGTDAKKKSTDWPLGLSVSLIFFILLFLLFFVFDVFILSVFYGLVAPSCIRHPQ